MKIERVRLPNQYKGFKKPVKISQIRLKKEQRTGEKNGLCEYFPTNNS
jgi:hypothetical protein